MILLAEVILRLSYDSAGNMLVSNLFYISNHKTHTIKYNEHRLNLLPKRIRSAKVVLHLSLESAGHMLSCNFIFIEFHKTSALDICRKSIKNDPKKCPGDP